MAELAAKPALPVLDGGTTQGGIKGANAATSASAELLEAAQIDVALSVQSLYALHYVAYGVVLLLLSGVHQARGETRILATSIYAAVAFVVFQISRLVFRQNPHSLLPLHLTHVPFMVFFLLSRGSHVAYAFLWCITLLLIALQCAEQPFSRNTAIFLAGFAATYILCVGLMHPGSAICIFTHDATSAAVTGQLPELRPVALLIGAEILLLLVVLLGQVVVFVLRDFIVRFTNFLVECHQHLSRMRAENLAIKLKIASFRENYNAAAAGSTDGTQLDLDSPVTKVGNTLRNIVMRYEAVPDTADLTEDLEYAIQLLSSNRLFNVDLNAACAPLSALSASMSPTGDGRTRQPPIDEDLKMFLTDLMVSKETSSESNAGTRTRMMSSSGAAGGSGGARAPPQLHYSGAQAGTGAASEIGTAGSRTQAPESGDASSICSASTTAAAAAAAAAALGQSSSSSWQSVSSLQSSSSAQSSMIAHGSKSGTSQTTAAAVGTPSGRTIGVLIEEEQQSAPLLMADDPSFMRAIYKVLVTADSWDFDCFELARVTNGRPLYYVMQHFFDNYDFPRHFGLDQTRLDAFFRNVDAAYRPNPYHNSIHACDVVQTMHYFLHSLSLGDLVPAEEVMAALLAACIHDVDHPGVTSAFLIETKSHLALRYNDQSVLENYHAAKGFELLLAEETNFLAALPLPILKRVRNCMLKMVLATDMSLHFEYITKFRNKTAGSSIHTLDLHDEKDRQLVLEVGIKCADISNPAKNRPLSQKWAELVMSEFFLQGDQEAMRGIPVSNFMDRRTAQVSRCQIGFIDKVVRPLYELWDKYINAEGMFPAMENIARNLEFWGAYVDPPPGTPTIVSPLETPEYIRERLTVPLNIAATPPKFESIQTVCKMLS